VQKIYEVTCLVNLLKKILEDYPRLIKLNIFVFHYKHFLVLNFSIHLNLQFKCKLFHLNLQKLIKSNLQGIIIIDLFLLHLQLQFDSNCFIKIFHFFVHVLMFNNLFIYQISFFENLSNLKYK